MTFKHTLLFAAVLCSHFISASHAADPKVGALLLSDD